MIAVGDEAGKIYVIRFSLIGTFGEGSTGVTIQSLPHWHAQSVATLCFFPTALGQSPFLLSAGKESVIVRWNIDSGAKTFVSRIGDSPIT